METVQYLDEWDESSEKYGLSPVVKVGDLILISGATGGSDSSDPEEQFTSAFRDVADMLAAAGSSWHDVVKMTTYHQGGLRKHMDVLLEVKDQFVKKPYPAWTGVGVTELARPQALIEVDIIAVLDNEAPPQPSTSGKGAAHDVP